MTERSRSEKLDLIRASAANLEYFFSRLEDAAWLPLLIEEGFFSAPTPPETGTTDEGEAWVRFPNWPPSQYLARIAAAAPELVVKAIEQVPETANPRVHQDIVTAATALPGELAAGLALRERSWLNGYAGHLMSYPLAAGDLIAHLAEEGEVKAALRLAGALLRISAAPESNARGSRHRAVAPVNDWEYGKIVETAWPPLMEAQPVGAFRFLCHRLADVIEIGFVEGSSFDPTYIWRSAVEDHAQNTGHSLFDTLVDAVRDAALGTAERGPEQRDLILEEFARHDARLFRRLTFFLLARFGSADQVVDALTSENHIDDFHVWHEYAELLRARFEDLQPDQQARVSALIAAGSAREPTATQKERGLTEEQFAERRRRWRLARYALIGKHLNGDAQADYEALVAEFGETDRPTFHSVVTHWVGPTSPFSIDELLGMGPMEVIEALRTWVPTDGPEDPSPEGLGRIVEAAVEKAPDVFARIAPEFADLQPDYVRGLLGGLALAAKAGTPFPWDPVLRLCGEIGTESAEEEPDGHPSLNWVRKSTVSLLSEGLNEGEAQIPVEERDRVWTIIEALLDDPDPSPDRDEGFDPATLAINSVRGEAMHAAIRYAFWIERAFERDGTFEGIGSVPEVAAALDRRLDPVVDASPVIHAVLGQWFAQFVRMDEEWARSLVPKIFPPETSGAERFSAGWNAYVVFNRAWVSVFEILQESYRLAVERFEAVDGERYMAGNPREKLGEHLFSMCLSGAAGLAADGLVAKFWTVAPAEIRKHIVHDIGWSLEHGNSQVSEEVRDRLVAMWEWVFEQSQQELAPLGAFGAWFGSDQLDDGWLLAQGQRVLELDIPLDPDHVVYEALPRMAKQHPRAVVELLRLMIVNDREGWSVLGSVETVRQTLAAAVDSADKSARSEAIAVLNLLGAHGMTEFRDLMP